MFDFCQDFADLFEFFVKISPGYLTAQSQSPRRGVSYCAESLMTPGSQEPILTTFVQAFKGTVTIMDSYSIFKGLLFFYFWKKFQDKIFLTPRGMILVPRGVSFFEPKNRIPVSQRILNQTRKYFNPLVSGGPGRFEL